MSEHATAHAREGEELARARAALVAGGADFALLSSLANVTYASGWEAPVPFGAMAELSYGTPLLLSSRDPAATLIVPNAHAAEAADRSVAGEILAFDTFDSLNPTEPCASASAASAWSSIPTSGSRDSRRPPALLLPARQRGTVKLIRNGHPCLAIRPVSTFFQFFVEEKT